MIKKTITYEDFNGQQQIEDHYFHLSKTEIVDLEYSHAGGLTTIIPEIVKSGDAARILEIFRKIISLSYGTRSEDGRRFKKDATITAEFMTSPAYDALFMELVGSEKAATDFITGIIPKDLATLAAKAEKEVPWANREPTQKELMNMTPEQLREAFQRKSAQASGISQE